MERFRKKLTAFVIVLAASMTLMSLPVMAKTNKNPASFSKTTLKYAETGVDVVAPTLVLGTEYESIDVKADAILKNCTGKEVVKVTAVTTGNNAGCVEVKESPSSNDINVFTITGKSESKKTVVAFTYTISDNSAGKQDNAPAIAAPKTKTVKLNVKVVKGEGTVNISDSDSWTVSVNGNSGLKVDVDGNETILIGNEDVPVDVYKIETKDSKNSKGNQIYTIPVQIPVSVNAPTTKLVFSSTDKKAAAFSGKLNKEKTAYVGTLKVNRNAFAANEDGVAEALLCAGVKKTATKYGKSTVYATADYILVRIEPDAKNPKIASASPTVNFTKANKANLVIQSGEVDESATLGAVYSSNGGEVTVEWAEVKDEDGSKGYTVEPGPAGSNYAVLTVTRPVKNAKLEGVVKNQKRSKKIKLTLNATKKVDSVTAKKVLDPVVVRNTVGPGKATDSTYYGTNMRTMYINGEKESVRTFYYLQPTKAIKESFTVTADKVDGYEGNFSNVTLKAVKDVSDSELNNKSSMKLTQNNKKTKSLDNTVTMTIAKKNTKLTKEELVIYQIAAADSYDKVAQSYGVGQYVAISVNPKTKEEVGDASVTIEGSTSGNMVIAEGDRVKLSVSANADVPYTLVSEDENVVIVEKDGEYYIEGISAGYADVNAIVAGQIKATLKVYVVGISVNGEVSMYPGDKADIGTITALAADKSTANVSVAVSGNELGYIKVISENVALKAGESAKISVSANKPKDKNTAAEVKVTISADFAIPSVGTKTVNKDVTVKVNPYTVTVNGGQPIVIDTADQAVVPGVAVEGAKPVPDPEYTLEVKPSSKAYGEFASVISGNSISGNSAGTGSVIATYKDVNGNEYTGTAQLTVTDKSGTKTYKNETVISFNGVTTAEAGINKVTFTTDGGKDTIKKAYRKFMDNVRSIPKYDSSKVEFTITLSGDSVNPVSEDSASANAAEPASGANEAEEEPAKAEDEVVVEEPVAEAEDSEEAVSENAVSEDAQINAEAEEAVSENEAAEPVAEVVVEEPVAEEEAVVEEPVKAEAPAEESAAEEEAAEAEKKQVIKVVVENGAVTSTPSENAVEKFIDQTYTDGSAMTMEVTFESNKSVPCLIGLANSVLQGKKESFNKTMVITFADHKEIKFSNVQLDKGLYYIGSEQFGVKKSGEETVVVYEGTLTSDSECGKLVKKLLNVNDGKTSAIAGVEYYGNDGKKDTGYKFR